MILVDMNQISLASLMMHLHMNKGELDEEMVRHMILNSVRMYSTMFNEKYGGQSDNRIASGGIHLH